MGTDYFNIRYSKPLLTDWPMPLSGSDFLKCFKTKQQERIRLLNPLIRKMIDLLVTIDNKMKFL